MSFHHYVNNREGKIHFNRYKLETAEIKAKKITGYDGFLDLETDISVATESEHDLVQENYILSTFLKDQVEANHQYQSRITELEQKLQVFLSTQEVQPQVSPPETLRKLVVSGDLLSQFQNAVSSINNSTSIDLSFYLQYLWKIEIEGYSNHVDLANLTIRNSDTNEVVVDTGLWSQTSDKYEMKKTILQGSSRIQDVRYLDVVANWNSITLTGITFYYKMGSVDPDDIGEPDI
jgi:hypothetical protein